MKFIADMCEVSKTALIRSSGVVGIGLRWYRNRYRPENHYMRGPGPKTLAAG